MDPDEASLGLCATCRFHRSVPGARSTFHLCEKSFTDPRFRRYPPLPVVACSGYEATVAADQAGPTKGGKL